MGKELVYSYIKEIARRLKEPRKYGEATVMIGAGFSKNAKSKGMQEQPPDWSELADKMYCQLYPLIDEDIISKNEEWKRQRIIKTSGKNVTKLADEYIANFDRNKLNHLIEDSISDELFLPGELHKKLLRLHWGDIFTTNYDTLLERTIDLIFREGNYKIVYSQSDLQGSIRPRIIKLHGSIPQVKPYIICDEDYRIYPIKNSAMVNTVQQAMLETRLCLIGFSGDDPNFQSWLGWLKDNMGECCPKIYLIGVYDNLSAPERKLLENKQITVIDISVLVNEKEKNKHFKAVSCFLDLLEQFQLEKDIFQERPYEELQRFGELENIKEYIQTMDEYTNKVWEWMHPFIMIPEEIRLLYAEYFSIHFELLIEKCKSNSIIKLVGKMVKILRKCLITLNEANAIILEELCNSIDLSSDNMDDYIEINLYLLEMYRLYGKKLEYANKLDLLDKYIEISPNFKNEVTIEKIKTHIEYFNYNDAKDLIRKIEENSYEYKLKKAGLYMQLSEKDYANKILSECSAELAQMRISDDLYSSYIGYLNLCFRRNNWVQNISDEFSDENYYNNKYNTRQIVIKQRENMNLTFFKESCKENENILPFNLNTGKSTTYTYYSSNKRNIYDKCISFIMTIDRLCLPINDDQASLFPFMYKKLVDILEMNYFFMSLIIRSNNVKIINQIFTRKVIESIDKKVVNELFDNIIKLSKMYNFEDTYKYKKYIISLNSIINTLSTLVIFLPDENIIDYMNLLNIISHKDDLIIKKDLTTILNRISTRFNSFIAEKIQNLIFKDFGFQYYLAKYFNFDFKINNDNMEEYYKISISMTNKENIIQHDCGISQLLVLWKYNKNNIYYNEIENVLWKNKFDTFPKSDLYYEIIWERLPYPDSIQFNELYYNLIENYKFVTSATDTGYIISNSFDSVYHFYKILLFLGLDDSKKLNFDYNLCNKILDLLLDFVEHEQCLLDYKDDYDFFELNIVRLFEIICDIVSLIYINAIKIKIIDRINLKISSIKDLLIKNNINITVIEMLDEIKKENFTQCMERFENIILSKNRNGYSNVFLGVECLLYYFEFNRLDKKTIDLFFENFMVAIKYIDIEYVKIIWIKLGLLIKRDFFMNNTAQIYISRTILKCIELYEAPAQNGERFYLDGLYNCVYALNGYYKRLLELKINILEELKKCVNKAKSIENYELNNIWNH